MGLREIWSRRRNVELWRTAVTTAKSVQNVSKWKKNTPVEHLNRKDERRRNPGWMLTILIPLSRSVSLLVKSKEKQ